MQGDSQPVDPRDERELRAWLEHQMLEFNGLHRRTLFRCLQSGNARAVGLPADSLRQLLTSRVCLALLTQRLVN